MALSYQVFKNVTTVTLGETVFYGCTGVTVNRSAPEIHASADADVYEGTATIGTITCGGTITGLDPNIADTFVGLTGSLSFVWKDSQGTTDKTVTIVGVTIAGVDQTASHDASSGATLRFVAESADGTIDPVSIA